MHAIILPAIAVRRRLETWLIVIPLMILALVGGNVSMATLTAHVAFVAMALLATGIMFFGLFRPKSADGRTIALSTRLDLSWLLLLGWTLFGFLGGDRRRAIEFWLFPLALQLPFYYAVVALQRRDWAAISWLRALFVVVGGLCTEALISAIGFYGQIADLHPPSQDVVPIPFRLYAVLDNPNVFGVILALTIPAAIGYTFWTSRRWERIAGGALLLGMGWALLATGSRGSQLATAAGVAGTLIGIGLARGWPQLLRHNPRAQMILAASLGTTILAIGGVLVVESRGAGRSGSEARHFDLWQTAIHAGVTHSAFGIGPGGFASAQLQSVSAPPTPIERHAHNLFLNFFAENGVFGSSALLFWLIMLASAIWRAWRVADITNRAWMSGLVGGMIAFGAAGMLDDPMAQMAPLSIVIVFVALLVSAAPLARVHPFRGEKFVPGFALLTTMLICGAAVWFTVSYATVWNVAQRNPNDSAQTWTNTAQTLDQAAANDPADALTIAQAAVAWVAVNASSAPGDVSNAALDNAIVDYQRVVLLDPSFAVHHLNLGALLLQRGLVDSALAELAAAVQRAPTSGIMHLNYGVALEQAGRTALAVAEYTQALTFGIAHSPLFWQATAIRRSVPTVTLKATLSDDTPHALTSALAALSRGDAAGARYEYTAAITLGGGDAATAALIALGDLETAQGNQSSALDQYRAAFSRIDRYGELGPGHAGDQTYAVNAFGRFAYISDYVPAVLTLDITPERAARFVLLANTLSSAGDYAASRHVYRRILIDNPGYQPAEAGLSQLGNVIIGKE